MKISFRYFFFSVALALLVLLAFLNQTLVWVYLIEPVTRILWLVYRTLLIVDQAVYWTLLILTAFIVGLWLLPGQQARSAPPAGPHLAWVENRTAHWEALLRAAEDHPDAHQALLRELENLNRSIDDLTDSGGQVDFSLAPLKTGIWQKIQAVWRRSLLSRFMPSDSRRPDAGLEQQVTMILNSLETKMEIHYDQSTNLPNID